MPTPAHDQGRVSKIYLLLVGGVEVWYSEISEANTRRYQARLARYTAPTTLLLACLLLLLLQLYYCCSNSLALPERPRAPPGRSRDPDERFITHSALRLFTQLTAGRPCTIHILRMEHHHPITRPQRSRDLAISLTATVHTAGSTFWICPPRFIINKGNDKQVYKLYKAISVYNVRPFIILYNAHGTAGGKYVFTHGGLVHLYDCDRDFLKSMSQLFGINKARND